VQGYLLRREFFDQLDAPGFDNRADDFVSRVADGHTHAAFEFGMQETFIVFRYGVFGKKLFIVLDLDGDSIKKASAVVGSVSAVPTQSDKTNGLLAGSKAQVEKQLGDAAQALADAVDPVDDLEGGAEYKRHLIGVFVRRAFIKALS
jgi:hypothetical protein